MAPKSGKTAKKAPVKQENEACVDYKTFVAELIEAGKTITLYAAYSDRIWINSCKRTTTIPGKGRGKPRTEIDYLASLAISTHEVFGKDINGTLQRIDIGKLQPSTIYDVDKAAKYLAENGCMIVSNPTSMYIRPPEGMMFEASCYKTEQGYYNVTSISLIPARK